MERERKMEWKRHHLWNTDRKGNREKDRESEKERSVGEINFQYSHKILAEGCCQGGRILWHTLGAGIKWSCCHGIISWLFVLFRWTTHFWHSIQINGLSTESVDIPILQSEVEFFLDLQGLFAVLPGVCKITKTEVTLIQPYALIKQWNLKSQIGVVLSCAFTDATFASELCCYTLLHLYTVCSLWFEECAVHLQKHSAIMHASVWVP